jgi:hypothetical protein
VIEDSIDCAFYIRFSACEPNNQKIDEMCVMGAAFATAPLSPVPLITTSHLKPWLRGVS